ncbi:MAG: matrixin family metalloprotease, partial [Planctomycetota bacterium]
SWMWAASEAVISGEPVYRCDGGITGSGVVAKYVTLGEGWDGAGLGSASLKYYFVGGTPDITNEEAVIEDAFAEWSKYADITFSRTYTEGENDSIDIMWAYGDHGDDGPFDGEGGILAHAFYPHYQGCNEGFNCNPEPIAGDMHFDESERWCVGCSCYQFDLFSVGVHELGHSLGVGHSYDPDALMYAFYTCWRDYDEPLHQDDIDGIRTLYASRCHPCNITVTSPAGGSTLECGDFYYINWNSECNRGNKVNIELYDGSSLVQTITSNTPDDGSYLWRIADGMPRGSNYRVKVSDKSDSDCAYGWSSYFTINCACTAVTSPSSGSTWECDKTYTIVWDPIPETDFVDVLLTDGSDWWPIADNISNTGSRSWEVPQGLVPVCNYQVEVRSSSDPSCKGISGTFCIICPCIITVSEPGGDWWEVGEELEIRWDSERYSGDVKIELYRGGSLDRIIVDNTADDGFYKWVIPYDGSLTGGDNYQIKVTAVGGSCENYSNDFGIAAPPVAQAATVITPAGTPVTITLQAVDEGYPDVLTYTIMSLPLHGGLTDPHAGVITDPCTSLANNGNQVTYMPNPDYGGTDSFTFKANDGGVEPGGGNSNTATVLIKVGVIYYTDLDDDAGWSATGPWQWGTPGGEGGSSYGNPDPNSGYMGLSVWGINLDGDYRTGAGGPYYLTTQAMDFSEYSNIHLGFYRWLNCDYQPYVHETVGVSNDGSIWTVVWENGGPPDINDDSWQFVEYDIGSVADNQPTVYIRWGHRVARASACAYSGWNIDEVEITGRRSNILVVDFGLDNLWMYQNLPGQSNSDLMATVSVTDDPMGNSSYSYAWEIVLPGDVNLTPVTVDGGGAGDASWTFAARGCDEPGGLSDSGQTFTVRVTITGDDYGNTGQAEGQFGIALLGDTNNDGVVNVADRSIANAFWRTGSAGPYTLRDCDVNCDGVVNVADRSIANAIWRGILGQNSVSSPCPLR